MDRVHRGGPYFVYVHRKLTSLKWVLRLNAVDQRGTFIDIYSLVSFGFIVMERKNVTGNVCCVMCKVN